MLCNVNQRHQLLLANRQSLVSLKSCQVEVHFPAERQHACTLRGPTALGRFRSVGCLWSVVKGYREQDWWHVYTHINTLCSDHHTVDLLSDCVLSDFCLSLCHNPKLTEVKRKKHTFALVWMWVRLCLMDHSRVKTCLLIPLSLGQAADLHWSI